MSLRERSLSNSLIYVGNFIWSPTNQLQLPMEFHSGVSYSKPRAVPGEVLLSNPSPMTGYQARGQLPSTRYLSPTFNTSATARLVLNIQTRPTAAVYRPPRRPCQSRSLGTPTPSNRRSQTVDDIYPINSAFTASTSPPFSAAATSMT